jgi:hypothetical protein
MGSNEHKKLSIDVMRPDLSVECLHSTYSSYGDGEAKEMTELSSKFEYDKQGWLIKNIRYDAKKIQEIRECICNGKFLII